MNDNVNHPAHYAGRWSNGAELIDITEHLDYCRGNAVKYLARAGYKNPDTELEDLEKAQFYVNRAIENFKAAQSGGIRVHITNTGDAESRSPRDFQNFWMNEMTQAVKELKVPRPGQVFIGWDNVPEGWVAEYAGVERFEVDGTFYFERETRQYLDSGVPVELSKVQSLLDRDFMGDNALRLVRYAPELVEAVRDALEAEGAEEESSPAVEPQAGEAVDRENPAPGWIIRDYDGSLWRTVERDGEFRYYCFSIHSDLDNPPEWSSSYMARMLHDAWAPYTYVRPVGVDPEEEEEEVDEPETEALKPGDTVPSKQVPDGWHFTIQAGGHLDYLQWEGRTLLSKDYSATTPSSPISYFQAQRKEYEATLVRQEPAPFSAEKLKVEPLDASKITVPSRVGQLVTGWENVPEDWVATFDGVERIEVDGELYLAELIQFDIRKGRPINLRVAVAATRPADMEGKAVKLERHDPEMAQAVRDTLGFQKVKAEIDEEEARPKEVKAGDEVDPKNPAQDWIIEDDEGDFWKLTKVNDELRLFLMEEEAGAWDDGEGWGVPLSSTFAPYTYVSPVCVEHFDDLPAGWWWQRAQGLLSVERQVDGDGKIWSWHRQGGGEPVPSVVDEATLRREEPMLGKYVLTDRTPLKKPEWDK